MSLDFSAKPEWTLHEVYLAWLIATNPEEYLKQNQISAFQCIEFRHRYDYTWQQFQELRSNHDKKT